ncbi:MAG: ABC transporter ATP-binding protein [Planctomycetes bacterium]|nr:ABC transporter ATP-binding protein [Planctomycetota bacterium]
MLEITDLRKVYEDGTVAVDGLCLSVKAGEIFVLLGANGAGKTSTIMLILGFTEPTAGCVTLNGVDVQKDPLTAKKHVAYVSENVTLYGNFTARQNLEFFTNLTGRTNVTEEEYRAAFLRVGLAENAFHRRVSGFSKGMRQRLGIAIAILKNSELIVLDEPTSGLDPKGGFEFLEIISQLKAEDKAILMSSHDIFRAKAIADRIGIMRNGQIIEILDKERIKTADLEKIYIECMKEITAGATSAKVQ